MQIVYLWVLHWVQAHHADCLSLGIALGVGSSCRLVIFGYCIGCRLIMQIVYLLSQTVSDRTLNLGELDFTSDDFWLDEVDGEFVLLNSL